MDFNFYDGGCDGGFFGHNELRNFVSIHLNIYDPHTSTHVRSYVNVRCPKLRERCVSISGAWWMAFEETILNGIVARCQTMKSHGKLSKSSSLYVLKSWQIYSLALVNSQCAHIYFTSIGRPMRWNEMKSHGDGDEGVFVFTFRVSSHLVDIIHFAHRHLLPIYYCCC